MGMMARLAWSAMAVLLVCGTVIAADGVNFEDLLIDDEDKPRNINDEEKAFEAAQVPFRAFLDACTDKAWDKASDSMKKVLRMDLSSDNSLKIRNLATEGQIVAIFSDAPKHVQTLFTRMLTKAENRRREWVKDQTRIAALVKQLLTGDHAKMWLAIRDIARAGQYAAPQLIAVLQNETDREARTRAALALRFCDRSVTIPLAEALPHVNDHVRQDICLILRESPTGAQEIPDQRSLPALKRIVQNEKINRATREEALMTMVRVFDAPLAELPSAQELYKTEAEKYYGRDVTIIESSRNDHVIWSWEGDKLVGRIVPECVYYLEMAEGYARKSLEIDPDFEQTKPLLICIIYAQYHTVNEVLAATVAVKTAPPAGFVDGLKARKARLEGIINTLPSMGKKHFYAALQLAIKDQQDSVAVSCVDVLKQLGAAKELPPAAMVKN